MNYIAARRQEEKERRRAEILDAAERVAASVGIHDLTMDQVAREARLSRGLLYVYFHDRHDLQSGICERGLRDLHARFLAAAVAELDGLQQVRAMGRAYVAFARERPVHFEAMVHFEASDASAPDPDSNHAACLAAGARVHALMTEALDRGVCDGSIAATVGDPNAVAISLWAFMHGTIQIASMKRGVLAQHGVSPDGLIDQALRMATIALQGPGG